jgi:hypothetical protein
MALFRRVPDELLGEFCTVKECARLGITCTSGSTLLSNQTLETKLGLFPFEAVAANGKADTRLGACHTKFHATRRIHTQLSGSRPFIRQLRCGVDSLSSSAAANGGGTTLVAVSNAGLTILKPMSDNKGLPALLRSPVKTISNFDYVATFRYDFDQEAGAFSTIACAAEGNVVAVACQASVLHAQTVKLFAFGNQGLQVDSLSECFLPQDALIGGVALDHGNVYLSDEPAITMPIVAVTVPHAVHLFDFRCSARSATSTIHGSTINAAQQVATYPVAATFSRAVALQSNTNELVVGTSTGNAYLYDLRQVGVPLAKLPHTASSGLYEDIKTAHIECGEQSSIVTGSYDGLVRRWTASAADASKYECTVISKHESPVECSRILRTRSKTVVATADWRGVVSCSIMSHSRPGTPSQFVYGNVAQTSPEHPWYSLSSDLHAESNTELSTPIMPVVRDFELIMPSHGDNEPVTVPHIAFVSPALPHTSTPAEDSDPESDLWKHPSLWVSSWLPMQAK